MTVSANIPQIPHIHLDNKWTPCLPAEEFGFLGERFICDLGGRADEAHKKLLIRKCTWEQDDNRTSELQVQKTMRPDLASVRQLSAKTYRMGLPTGNGKFAKDNYSVLQQDITGYISLKRLVLSLAAAGKFSDIWQLFYSACKSLNEFGTGFESRGQLVPLQPPSTLAVHQQSGAIALLDGDLEIPSLSPANRSFFQKWFPVSDFSVKGSQASLLHSRALLVYFRELLGYVGHGSESGHASRIVLRVSKRLEQLESGQISLDELEKIIADESEDWSLIADADEVEPGVLQLKDRPQPMPVGSESARHSAFWRVLLLLIGLGIIAFVFFLFRGQVQSPFHASEKPAGLLFPRYLVILPRHGASVDRVQAALESSFPNEKITFVYDSPRSLSAKIDTIANSFKGDLKQVDLLFQHFAEKLNVRFKDQQIGKEYSIKAYLQNGGVYSVIIQNDKTEIRTIGNARLFDSLIEQPDLTVSQRQLLQRLKDAVMEFQNFHDAIQYLGERPGFIVQIEPNLESYEKTRTILREMNPAPIFAEHRFLAVFDAIDSATGGGGGIARYVLQLDRRCYWRQVAGSDRQKVDYANNPNNSKMAWREFAPGKKIEWQPIGVLRTTGRTDPIATFDIAVAWSKSKVVVFRNQSIMQGEIADEVKKQVKSYIERGLRLSEYELESAVSIQTQEKQYTGALIYSYLASLLNADVGEDVLVIGAEEFDKMRQKEDGKLN